ncbi:MAG: formimidoylglutamate deiminase [Alphaproteobacteria bacterium]|nr:formimidoylglutamate deiminase [Alphaproteobacteria bacterium]
MKALYGEAVLLPDGWTEGARIDIDGDGNIAAITVGGASDGAERARGPIVPGLPNLHSHAFQRAMAGLTERRGAAGRDSFWTWREVMYGFVARLNPATLQAIATQLYVEMLEAGYTAVAEFHYLHHGPDGVPYADPAELSNRVIAAAATAGIGITHLPVLYAHGGFGGQPPTAGQRRFVNDGDRFLRLVEELRGRHHGFHDVRIGIAPHSLRAVNPRLLADVHDALNRSDATAPIHIHIAEQTREVDECLAWSGTRPVAWLLANAPVDRRWCLVHATHMTEAETRGLAATGAVAGLCPTTEANLGDGLFPLEPYLIDDGLVGVGSDSHISVSPVEELRWLEYGQRLAKRARNVASTPKASHVGAGLYRRALVGGAHACARPIGAIAPGHRADLVVLDAEHPLLVGRSGDTLLDAWVFAGNAPVVRDVMVGGTWVVRRGRHARRDEARADFARAINTLMD